MKPNINEMPVSIIKPPHGFEAIDFAELGRYRDLFYFLVTRDVKVLYAQTILGFSWALINPAVQIIVFTVIFGKIANVPTDGIPYFLFSTVAIIPWTYMSEAMTHSSQSLVTGQGMLGKVYFPRMIFPLTPLFSKLVDFGISLLLLVGVLIYYKVAPTWNMLLLPAFVLYMVLIPAGIGLWLSSLAVRFRDVKFAMQFIIRMLIYTAPVLYSASYDLAGVPPAVFAQPYRGRDGGIPGLSPGRRDPLGVHRAGYGDRDTDGAVPEPCISGGWSASSWT